LEYFCHTLKMKNPLSLLAATALSLTTLSAQNTPCVDATAFHIVMLGSSTAAGAGASPSDSAWVNLYRAFLQAINPGNEVTNLAQGGFTTYRIMPSDFVPPPGRPAPDTNRNITKALALAPDAIIVNLPSNDVSSGFSVEEQLANFDTVVLRATAAQVPIWVCTTQPKNYGGNPVPIQKQLDVRDSILARYGDFALDFWTGLADSTNQIDPAFDSGDGTHLNNMGHALLFGRVRDKNLPLQIFQLDTLPDFTPIDLTFADGPACGEDEATLQLVVLNRGADGTDSAGVSLMVENLTTGEMIPFTAILPEGLNSCQTDTFTFIIETAVQGNYRLTAAVAAPNDGNLQNDTLGMAAYVPGVPFISALPDSACTGPALILEVMAAVGDSIRWYGQPTGGTPVGSGPVFQTPVLTAGATYYAEAVRGGFHFFDSLAASPTANINWNGVMFDLVADTALVLDSFAVNVHTPGPQQVQVFTKNGSHLGFELSDSTWTERGLFDVMVTDSSGFVTVALPEIFIEKNDTLGVYLQLAGGSAKLWYQSVSQPVTVSAGELTLIAGSGASHNFGGNFYPRFWKGKVFYHFGEKPDGDCKTERVPVEAVVFSPATYLGADTILDLGDTLVLDAGPGFGSYLWTDGSTSQTIELTGEALGTGIFYYTVTVTDDFGCTASDEITVVFAPLTGTGEAMPGGMRVYPNPARDWLMVELPPGGWKVELFNARGQRCGSYVLDCGQACEKRLSLRQFPAGVYWLMARWKAPGCRAEMDVSFIKKVELF
jgi:lysophospholipase L1-like esterase